MEYNIKLKNERKYALAHYPNIIHNFLKRFKKVDVSLLFKKKLKAKRLQVDNHIKHIILDLLQKCAQSNWEYSLPDEPSFLTLAFYNLSLYPKDDDDNSTEIVFGSSNYKVNTIGKPVRINQKNKQDKLNCKPNGKELEVIYMKDDLVNEILLQNIKFKNKNLVAEDVSCLKFTI